MADFVCPKGHVSSEPDYCSECGAKMVAVQPADQPAAANAVVSLSGESCPECGTPRENHNVVFCDVCGYNFVTGVGGGLGIPAPPTQAAPAPAPQAVATAIAGWTITLSVDPTLREPGSPEPPANMGPFRFALTAPVSLIGRRSEARGIFPEIPIAYDDAISHRHALLQLDPAGALLLRDIGSANGTRLNGKDLPPLTDVPLHDGDSITLGHWSRITVAAA